MKYLLNVLFMILFPISIIANKAEIDTLKTYKLGEIEVLNDKINANRLIRASQINVPHYKIDNSDVASFANLQQYIPSGVIRTNSRGESMLFLRGAGERQLGLFLDGASINIPWDNRLDLTFVPTDIIGNVRVNKSANSMFYGPNVIGGAVSITTVERSNDGFGLSIKFIGGDGNQKLYSITNDGKFSNFNYIANVSYAKSDGFLMSANAPDSLGNQRVNSSLRTNTDFNRLNTFVRGEYKINDLGKIGISISYTTQEKGVAPETFAATAARFWRYPSRDRFMTNLNGEFVIAKQLELKANIWYDDFAQQIDSYKNFDYKEILESQYDKDYVVGSRLSVIYDLEENHLISFIFNGFTTEHKQHLNNNPDDLYSQNTISTGIEYRGLMGDLDINLGAGYDVNTTPQTGLFKEAEGTNQDDISAFATIRYNVLDFLSVFVSGSQRTRFPSMREQYDGALNSFKTNPNLKPEKGLLTEFGTTLAMDNISGNLSVFYNQYNDLIERIRLTKEQDSLRRRMRVNYSEAIITGVDLNLSYNPIKKMDLSLFLTYMNIKAKSGGKDVEHLVQKPDILAGFFANYNFDFGLKPQFEIEYTGKQYDSDPADGTKFIALDPTLIFNIRFAYSFSINNIMVAEVFARVNNLTDEYKLSQWGLPMEGRTAFVGFNIKI